MSTPVNPLLEPTDLPLFSLIAAEHVEVAIDNQLAAGRKKIASLLQTDQHYTWNSLVKEVDEQENILNRTWSPISHLNSVMNSESLREAYNKCIPKLTEYATEFGQNEALYKAYQSIKNIANGCPN